MTGLSDLTIMADLVIGTDPVTGDPLSQSFAIDTTITRDADGDLTNLAVSGHAAAIAASMGLGDGDGTAFSDLLDSANTVRWNSVGSEISVRTFDTPSADVALNATSAADTFAFVANPFNSTGNNAGNVVDINGFTTSNDVLNVNAIIGTAVFGAFNVNGTTGDLDLLTGGAKNIGSLFNGFGNLIDSEVVSAGTGANGQIVLGDNARAVVAVAVTTNATSMELYLVSDTDATAGFTGDAELIGVIGVNDFALINANNLL
jgi:hypothetical protein